MTLGLAVAPRQREGRTYRRQVRAQARREAPHLFHATALNPLEPSIEFLGTATVHYPQELSRKAAHLGDQGLDLAQRPHETFMLIPSGLVGVELLPSGKPPKYPSRRRDRHRSDGNSNDRIFALRRQQAQHPIAHGRAASRVAPCSNLPPYLRWGLRVFEFFDFAAEAQLTPQLDFIERP